MLPAHPSFEDFFQAAWGRAPYPWQRTLAAAVAAGAWPDAIGVPTGTGKTASVDVAVWAMAAEADREPAARTHPRRVVVVVDRRTIVDQSFQRAVALRDRLDAATDGPLAAVRDRLRALMGRDAARERPLVVALLRGGLPGDDGWARRPDQPLIAVSTVDQVGSRLLFRGYGVRPAMQPVHAGLLGHDTLFLLDEVHLSRPFEETLEAIASRYRQWREVALPDRFRFVRLSATGAAERALALGPEDLADPGLMRRLIGAKPVRVARVEHATHKGRTAIPSKGWVDALVAEVRALVGEGGRRSVGLIVNRVDVARAAHAALAADSGVRAALLTGRMRPADRGSVVDLVVRHAGPDRAADANADRPFVCVSTQTLEAGADLDFDGLVTELASVDALVQRFGRVNRTGGRGACPIVVLAPKPEAEDPIYGPALAPTLKWLEARGEGFDAATAQLSAAVELAPPEAWPARAAAAVLLPAHLDLLAQTGPAPAPDPDPAHYLHGLERPGAEVQVVWRADIDLEDPEGAARRLAAVPPSSFEALSLPIGAARRWLRGDGAQSFGDAGVDPDDEQRRWKEDPPVGFTRDAQGWRAATAQDLRPGGVIVLPSEHGGLRDGNFDPEATAPVADVGDLGGTLRAGRAMVRLDLRVWGEPGEAGPRWPGGASAPPTPDQAEQRGLAEARRELLAWLAALPATRPRLWGLLGPRPRLVAMEDVWLLVGPRLDRETLLALGQDRADPLDTALSADDASSMTERPVPLDEHLRGVAGWARSLATAAGLPPALVGDLERAGRWHDLGKADPRFQVLLHGGDEVRAASRPPLAKSGMPAADAHARRRAAEVARLPAGFRHEMASVALLARSEAGRALLAAASDPELVLHLVASHHGHARPFAPAEDHRGQPAALRVRAAVDGVELEVPADHGMDALDSGVAERFFVLQRRYGWWGLAWLEALLRLADHRESEAETRTQEATP